MKIIDISLTLSADLVTWPGDPKVQVERVRKIEDGANSNNSHLSLAVHTGTHVDSPFHFFMEGSSVETLPLDILTGPAVVITLDDDVNEITEEVLRTVLIPPDTKRILFRTRNSALWARAEKDFDTGFVAIGPDGADYLVSHGIQLVGLDYLSIAPYKRSRPTHEAFLKAGVVVVEGLNLSDVQAGHYTLVCLPLKLAGSDGAPARAILMQE